MNRNIHSRPKDLREKFQYNKGLKEQDVEPTLLKDAGYKLSSNADIDLGASQPFTPPTTSSALKEHFRNNWPAWLFTALLSIGGWILIDARIDIGVIFEKISNQNDNIKSQKAEIEEIKKEQNNQNLKIQENKIKIENLEKTTENQNIKGK